MYICIILYFFLFVYDNRVMVEYTLILIFILIFMYVLYYIPRYDLGLRNSVTRNESRHGLNNQLIFNILP